MSRGSRSHIPALARAARGGSGIRGTHRTKVFVAAVVAASAVACLVVAEGSPGDGSRISYFLDGEMVAEQAPQGAIEFSPRVGAGRTFFGWSLHPDGSGRLYSEGDCVPAGRSASLYAVVADGIIAVDGSRASFSSVSEPPRFGEALVDLRHSAGVDSVSIDGETASLIRRAEASVRVEFRGGLGIRLGREWGIEAPEGGLAVSYSVGPDGSMRAAASSGGAPLRAAVTVIAGPGIAEGGEARAFSAGPGGMREIPCEAEGGRIAFRPGSESFRTVALFPVSASGGASPSSMGFEPVYSAYFESFGKMAAGDAFTLGRAGEGMRFSVSGAVRVGGAYVVDGTSAVVISVERGACEHRVSLPREQTGYVITADRQYVPDGGACVLRYRLLPGYSDAGLSIAVNGRVVSMDGLGEIRLRDVRDDKAVTVEGVVDVRVYSVSVPREQTGYSLTVSPDRVHHGQSYEVRFSVSPGYGGPASVRIAGGPAIDVSSGAATVRDVRGSHSIIVEGVSLSEYVVSAGKNTVVRVNGLPGSVATIFDVVTVDPAPGFSMPPTYDSHVSPRVARVGGGYRVSSDESMPSIVRITVGENLVANGTPEHEALDVCPGDVVVISAEPGYLLSPDYASRVAGIGGTAAQSPMGAGYSFGDSVSLPAIHRVVFMAREGEHARFYCNYGDEVPSPGAPSDPHFIFDSWEGAGGAVLSDLEIASRWIPRTYRVSVGGGAFAAQYMGEVRRAPCVLDVEAGGEVRVFYAPPPADLVSAALQARPGGAGLEVIALTEGVFEIYGDCSLGEGGRWVAVVVGDRAYVYLSDGPPEGLAPPPPRSAAEAE
ncbi:MAG: hypothetical protein LBG62_03710 [Candidatus Methanoplasma sp.]|jgi:hypothetical protein|nr:hypothetical protein [Candidatus Methanoplasma sp.]